MPKNRRESYILGNEMSLESLPTILATHFTHSKNLPPVSSFCTGASIDNCDDDHDNDYDLRRV